MYSLVEHPMGYIATDGAGFPRSFPEILSGKLVHPRCFGTAPKFLKYVLESKKIPLETAVAKLSSGPAKKMGLDKRGLLRPHFYADLVLWDPATIADHATYKNPFLYPSGIEAVWVNGRLSVTGDAVVGSHGKFLRRTV